MRVMRIIVIAAALLAGAPLALADSVRFGFDAEYLYDNNVPRGPFSADRKGDSAVSAEGSATGTMMLGPRSGAVLRAAARASAFATFNDLNSLALSGRAAYRVQPGTDFSSPVFELAASLWWLKHSASALRDGPLGTLEASVASHVTDRVRLGAGVGLDKRHGGGSAGLYDLDSYRLWLTLDYRAGLRNTVYGRLGRLSGDQVFCSVTVTGMSDVWEADPALSDGLGRPADCYKMDARTWSLEIGINVPLTGQGALDFAVTGHRSKSGAFEYDVGTARASYLYRF
jgi:hypothetical protein